MKFTENNLLLYAVTDRTWQNGLTIPEQVEMAVKGGATMIQLREKILDFDGFLAEAKEVKKITGKYGIPLIINDNIEIARLSNADGVHLGQSDMPAEEARRILGPDKIIGISARTPEQAKAAQDADADYLGVGAVFTTSTKADAKPLDHKILKAICDETSIPVVAIGGISKNNIRRLTGTHISGVAVVSAIFAQKDIESAAKELLFLSKQTVMQGAIFDLDGTLVDSMPYWENIAADYLKSIGITPKSGLREQVRKMFLRESAEFVKKEYSLSLSVEEIINGVNETVAHYYCNDIVLKPGVTEMLQSLTGVKKYVCTLTDSKLTRTVLERNGILKYFDGILSAVDYNIGKDTPKIYEMAREALGTPKQYTYIFEDSDYAIETAKKGGFTVVGVYDEHTDRSKIESMCDFYTVGYNEWK
jgi:thiamine-phosphate diphosphorylase